MVSHILDQYGHPIHPAVPARSQARRRLMRLPAMRGGFDIAKTTSENRKHWANADALSAVQDRIAELAAQLVTARRSGQFERRQSAACDFCPYGKLCVKLRSN